MIAQTHLVLVALAACVFAIEAQDQAAAEQYYHIHGVYPSWYQYGVNALNGVRGYPFAGYPFPGTPFAGYPSAVYPSVAAPTVVKNVAYYPYPAYPSVYPYDYNTFPYGPYVAVPYVAAAPAAPVKA